MNAAEHESGQLTVYDDVASGEKGQELSLPALVSNFLADGKKLAVVTSTQTAYLIDVSTVPQSAKQ